MKVYIVKACCYYEGFEIAAIYLDKARAKAHVDQLYADKTGDFDKRYAAWLDLDDDDETPEPDDTYIYCDGFEIDEREVTE